MTRPGAFRTEDLTVRYGGVLALDSVSITVEPGEFAGLIGPNGAGKTTFIDSVTGYAKASGKVELGGIDVLPLAAHARVAAGVSRTFQSLELFEDLTVAENVLVSTENARWWSPIVEFVRPRTSTMLSSAVEEVLDLVGLTAHLDAYPPDLSLGERKLVSVARALATEPALLLLDEPAAGLDSDASLVLGRQLQSIAERGVSILLVDHDLSLILDVCERINVLDFGRLIASGTADEVRNDPAVVAAYLGEDIDTAEAVR
ncbi:ABC transporter ATP-binding protein [Gordonia hydrophobica]|uniref:ABC transporter ATP-binding protein n=1 Tax=Gordonia hydrophobica TaxID=40516 RepID=A0ABZ2TWC4_9ACTN|nr:ABC transporter ATP-binding protein [Gordonia hydrophobica]MBM7365807.1 ABC-type branched-subunit amino acid transport system ATPase component [Gordonia hydrophobica]